MTRFSWRSCGVLVALSVVGCGESSPTPMHVEDAGHQTDASDGGDQDASATSATLIPTITQEGAWTVEQFESLAIDAVEITSDEAGTIAIAVTRGDQVSVLTPQSGGYAVRDIDGARGPIRLAASQGRIVVKHSGLNNAVTLTELEESVIQSEAVESHIALRALSSTTVAFSPSDGLLVLADTLNLSTYQRAITTYRADMSWQAEELLSFLPPESTSPVEMDVARMNGRVAMLTDNEGTLTFYEDALSSTSSAVASLHAAASLCIQNGHPRVIAADAHGTGFPDHLRVFDQNGSGTWVATELESARSYSETRCAATPDEMLIVDAASVAPLLVRGNEVRRLASFGDLRARPRVIAVDETIHLVWANGNQKLMHATANASEL